MRKMIASAAVVGSLGVGGIAGLLLGTPSLSGAQNTSVNAGTQSVQVASDPVAGTPAALTADPAAPDPNGGPLASALDDALKGLVDKGTINQSQSDAVKAAIQAKLADLPKRAFGGPGGPGRKGGLMGEALTATAKALNMNETDLLTELKAGKTVAAIAKEKNVDVNTVINALVNEATGKIDQAVKDGKLTNDQATAAKANLKDRITNQVNNPLPLGGPGMGGPGMGGPKPGGPNIDAAAKALGTTTDDLVTQLRDGKTIADVAKAKNVDVNKVIDAIVADTTARIDQAVKDGKLTADQATQKKANLKDRVTEQVNNPAPPKGHGHRGGPDGPAPDGPATAKPASTGTL